MPNWCGLLIWFIQHMLDYFTIIYKHVHVTNKLTSDKRWFKAKKFFYQLEHSSNFCLTKIMQRWRFFQIKKILTEKKYTNSPIWWQLLSQFSDDVMKALGSFASGESDMYHRIKHKDQPFFLPYIENNDV